MKVYFKTVGCRVNQVETDSLRGKFAALGHAAAASPEEADLVVVNTCSVTAKADRDCVTFLRRTAAANPRATLAATGCLATLDPAKILAAAPGARLFSNKEKENIPAEFCGAAAGGGADFFSVAGFHGHARAFVKVQEGCSLKCAYCLVSLARGEISSKPLPAAVAEIKRLIADGFSEIVLCGTHLGIYSCPGTGAGLAGLCEKLLGLEGAFRLRLSSLEPGELSPALLRVLTSGGRKFCDHFHLPLQAGSDAVLKAMRRNYSTALYASKVAELRALFPGAGIYADIIAGYPSETDADFAAGLDFIRELGLSGLHVFSYSPRPGTPAARLKPHPHAVVSGRSAALRALDRELRAAFAAALLGTETGALVVRNKGGRAQALAANFMDLEFPGPLERGSLVRARLTSARAGVCLAEALP